MSTTDQNTNEILRKLKNIEKRLKALFRALFQAQEWREQMSEPKRLRMLRLCNSALDEIRVHNNGPILAPNAWKVVKEMPSSSHHEAFYGTKVIQAIQIEGRYMPKEGIRNRGNES